MYHERILLHAYCLLPNHFHLLIEQKDEKAMTEFMQSLQLSFTAIVNKRNCRVGHLFQSIYRGRRIKSDVGFISCMSYIHNNPDEDIMKYHYSSLRKYLKKERISGDFLSQDRYLSFFNNDRKSMRDYLLSGLSSLDSRYSI